MRVARSCGLPSFLSVIWDIVKKTLLLYPVPPLWSLSLTLSSREGIKIYGRVPSALRFVGMTSTLYSPGRADVASNISTPPASPYSNSSSLRTPSRLRRTPTPPLFIEEGDRLRWRSSQKRESPWDRLWWRRFNAADNCSPVGELRAAVRGMCQGRADVASNINTPPA